MIKLPFIASGRREYALEPLSHVHAGDIALLHREDFARPWSASEFLALIAQDGVFGFVAREVGRGKSGIAGFVLARVAAGEGEILTVAVARVHRRAGLGRALMDAVLRSLHHDRAEALFLEVDETNRAALALYRRLGFQQVGARPAYYTAADGTKTGALVLRRNLGRQIR
jgi:ribosomal-protein-alanine N-acetyltransferase